MSYCAAIQRQGSNPALSANLERIQHRQETEFDSSSSVQTRLTHIPEIPRRSDASRLGPKTSHRRG